MCPFVAAQCLIRKLTNLVLYTTVEATTLNERCLKLRPQDRFLRDNISSNDVLIVSIGGNDIALLPTPCTIASVAGLLCLPMSCLESGRSFGSVPVNDCCCGCGASLASCTCSCPPCLGYFRHLFGTRYVNDECYERNRHTRSSSDITTRQLFRKNTTLHQRNHSQDETKEDSRMHDLLSRRKQYAFVGEWCSRCTWLQQQPCQSTTTD
jgi:hypothetical protein